MTFDILKNILIGTLTHDTLRYILGAGGVYLLINLALEGVLHRRRLRDSRPGWDQMWREIRISLRTILIFAAVGTSISLAKWANLIPIYADIAEWGWAYFWASVILIIVAHDAWFYWTHWAMHRPRLFRLFHRTHHLSHNPTPFTSYSFDIGEALTNAIFLPIFVAVIPMHPLALLIFVSHMMLRNAIGHCGYEVFPARQDGRPLFGWMTTVTHHDLHHSNARYNLGLYFTWWDQWMGTENPDYLATFARATASAPKAIAPPIRSFLGALGLGLLTSGAPDAAQARDLDGIFAAPGLGMVLQFAPCPQSPALTCGRLLWGWEMDDFDHADPGDIILSELAQSNIAWDNGRLLDPSTGRVYRGRIKYLDPDHLRVVGCAGPICRTQIWRRLDSVLGELHDLN